MYYDQKIKLSIISGILSLSLIIPGAIGFKKDKKCDITDTYHAHQYEMTTNSGVTLKNWRISEKDRIGSFYKTNEFIPTTMEDIEAFKCLDSSFYASDGIDYINHELKTNKDYMEFYYYYTEDVIRTRTVYDDEGESHTETYIETVTHSGWSSNPRHEGNTGEVRVCHYVYRLFKLMQDSNGNFKRIYSDYVDDPREIMDEYTYSNLDNDSIVSTEFKFSKHELPYLVLEDFDPYYQPIVEDDMVLKK